MAEEVQILTTSAAKYILTEQVYLYKDIRNKLHIE